MKTFALLLCLLVPSTLLGDELLLKDGRKIPWKTLSDEGDEYLVDGKTRIRKADVDRFSIAEASAILTGAAVSFDKKRKLETVNLLQKVDLARDQLSGTWKDASGIAGSAAGEEHARLQVPYVLPEEYDLTIVVERKEGTEDFGVGLVGGGRPFMFHFDVGAGSWSGIITPGADGSLSKVTERKGKFFGKGPKTLTFMVRKDAFFLLVDGKEFAKLKPDWTKLSILPTHAPTRADSVSFSIYKGSFVVSRLALAFPVQ